MSDDDNITISPEDFGHTDGEVIENPAGMQEKIVYDYDEQGNVLGWHKEAVNG